MSTLFISYSTKDRPTAEIFYAKLIEMGYEPPFRDDHLNSGIPAGSEWERELYRKLRLCKALIVLVSRNWLDSKWCFAELAYAKAMGKEFFPVLIDDSPDVPSVVAERQGIRLSDSDIWQRLRRGLIEANLAPENDFPWPVTGFDECPYPGLSPFEAHHAGVYFGRDDEILELRERLNQMKDKGEPRLLYVVGASGSGKSSLVKAGLLPRLTRKESSRWCVLPTFRWNELRAKGRDWPEQLAVDLLGAWPSNADTKSEWKTLRERYLVAPLTRDQRNDETEIANYNAAIARAADRYIDDTKDVLFARDQRNATPLLIIDQFEELLSATDDSSVKPFLEFLGCVMSSPRSPWRCIATVRTDFLAAIQTRAELIAWKDHTDVYSLPLMKPDRFYDVIRHPAERVGITFESDALVDRMVKDTGTNDALPLLAFTLRELYERYGDDKRFTFDEYDTKLGGLEGCLTEVANELLTEPFESGGVSHDEREKKLHLAFSNHLVRINDKDQFVRRTALWSELPEQARPLLQRFIDRRLITSRSRDKNIPNSERVVEVAHEALFRKWDKLAGWLDDRRDLLRWRRYVDENRRDVERSGLSASRLAEAEPWLSNRAEELTPAEVMQIRSGVLGRRRRRLLLTIAFLGLCALAIATVLSARTARYALKEANLQLSATEWQVGVVARDRDNDSLKAGHHMLRAAEAAQSAGDEARATSFLIAATDIDNGVARTFTHLVDGDVVNGALLSRNGSHALTWGSDGLVKLWTVAQDKPLRTFQHKNSVVGAAFSRNEKRVLCHTDDGTVLLWDIAQEQPVGNFSHETFAFGAVLSHDETRVLTWGVGGHATLWDVAQQQSIRTFDHLNTVTDAVFCSEETRIVTWDNCGTARLWDITQVEPLQTFESVRSVSGSVLTRDVTQLLTWQEGVARLTNFPSERTIREFPHLGRVRGAFFTADETHVVTWTDTDARLWDVMQDAPIRSFPHNSETRGPVLSGDQSRILIWGDRNTVELRDVAKGRLLQTFRHEDSIGGAAFGADADVVLTWSWDGTARLWNVTHDKAARTFPHQGPVVGGAANRNGTRLLTWSNNLVSWWDNAKDEPIRTFEQNGQVFDAVLGPNERRILAWGDERFAYLWDVGEENPVRTFPHDNTVRGAMSNRDMSRILSWSEGDVYLWEVSQETPLRQWKHDGAIAAAFTPDERGVVSWSADGTSRMFQVTENVPTQTKQHSVGDRLLDREMGYISARFSRDATKVLTCGGDEVRLWDVTKERPLRRFRHANGVTGAAFSHSETHILTWSFDGKAILWDVTLDDPVRTFGHPKAVLHATFNQDGTRILTGSEDGTVKLWDVTLDEPLRTFHHRDSDSGATVGGDDVLLMGAAFTQDESFVMTWGKDGTVRLWDVRYRHGVSMDQRIRRYSIRTGTRLDGSGRLRILSFEEWVELLDATQ